MYFYLMTVLHIKEMHNVTKLVIRIENEYKFIPIFASLQNVWNLVQDQI